MASRVKLISVRPLLLPSLDDEFIWLYHTDTTSRNSARLDGWNPYPPNISSALEKAFKRGDNETFIGTSYRIDFIELLQQDICDPKRQLPIRRHKLKVHVENDRSIEFDIARQERLSFSLDMTVLDSTSMDTFYHGSQFVRDWLLAFTHGKLNVKFDAIFPALINGLKLVGRNEPERVVSNIVRELYSIKEETSKKKEWEKMQKLQDCCAKLYTKPCFLFRVVNTALRCDDRTKLNELGPYCYLVYNYIGRHTNQSMPFRHRLRQSVRVMDAQPMILYRGDAVCSKTLEEYKQAAGKKDKCFRWLPFVSTSLDRDIARNFGQNVLYNIEVQQYLSNDQFTYLNNNTYFENEKEILLKPGARFQVIKVEPDCQLKRQLVHIKIIPSFVSNLI